MKKNDLIPFFDTAYQGFASGCLERDAFAIRLFLEKGFQMFVAQSYAKNMGLYGERCGCLHLVTMNKKTAENVLSQIKLIIRPMYSSPPMHGALIVHKILSKPEYFQRWRDELNSISNRIIQVRKLLKDELERLRTPGNWEHITNQIGMFSYTGLSGNLSFNPKLEKVCDMLINQLHVYMLRNGRISLV